MEIRDQLHGAVLLLPHEVPIVNSRAFQRLRFIKQMGFGELAYPGASHNRYIHSIGALAVADRALMSIEAAQVSRGDIPFGRFERFRILSRLAALLHDIGHGPLSHTTEAAMPTLGDIAIPVDITGVGDAQRQATHEDYTLKIILDSELTPLLARAGLTYGFTPLDLASIIEPALGPPTPPDFFWETIRGERINCRTFLQQLISSELDVDRMDYLRRDSLHAGVSYGVFDLDWIIRHLDIYLSGSNQNRQAVLAFHHRALYAVEDFLISRFHMFLMVYHHRKSVVYDEMLHKYLQSPHCPVRIPANISDYISYDDGSLFEVMKKDRNNPWASAILDKKPYLTLVERHSEVPKTKRTEFESAWNDLIMSLREGGIQFLESQSTGELSKAKSYNSQKPSVYALIDDEIDGTTALPLEDTTDLFDRFSTRRRVRRIYVAPENFETAKNHLKNRKRNVLFSE